MVEQQLREDYVFTNQCLDTVGLAWNGSIRIVSTPFGVHHMAKSSSKVTTTENIANSFRRSTFWTHTVHNLLAYEFLPDLISGIKNDRNHFVSALTPLVWYENSFLRIGSIPLG